MGWAVHTAVPKVPGPQEISAGSGPSRPRGYEPTLGHPPHNTRHPVQVVEKKHAPPPRQEADAYEQKVLGWKRAAQEIHERDQQLVAELRARLAEDGGPVCAPPRRRLPPCCAVAVLRHGVSSPLQGSVGRAQGRVPCSWFLTRTAHGGMAAPVTLLRGKKCGRALRKPLRNASRGLCCNNFGYFPPEHG